MERLNSRMFILWMFASYGVVNGAYVKTKKIGDLFQSAQHNVISRPINTNLDSDLDVKNRNHISNEAAILDEGNNNSDNNVDKTFNNILEGIYIRERKIRSQDFSDPRILQSADIDGDSSSKYKDVFGGGVSKTDLHTRVKRF